MGFFTKDRVKDLTTKTARAFGHDMYSRKKGVDSELSGGTLGRKIEATTRGGLRTNQTFNEVNPWKDFFNREYETEKVRNEYQPYHLENVGELTQARDIGEENLGVDLGSRGLSGEGGTAKFQRGLFDNKIRTAFRDLDRAKKDAIMGELAKRESEALQGYLMKQGEYDSNNYLTYGLPSLPGNLTNSNTTNRVLDRYRQPVQNIGTSIGKILNNVLKTYR